MWGKTGGKNDIDSTAEIMESPFEELEELVERPLGGDDGDTWEFFPPPNMTVGEEAVHATDGAALAAEQGVDVMREACKHSRVDGERAIH